MEPQENQNNRRRRRDVPAQYRRKRSKKKLLIIGGALLLCIVVAVIAIPAIFGGNSANTPGETTPPPADQVIHIMAGGDINITDKSVAAGQTTGGYDFTNVFKDVLPILSSADVTMLNFEGVLSGSTYGSATKAAPPEMLKALADAGVDILQTANSYSVFDGLRGLNATLQGVRNAGITPLGTYATNAAFNESGGYIIWEIQGIKVAMMAFTKGMDGMGLPSGSEKCVNLLYTDYNSTYKKVNEEGITQVVRNAAAHDPDIMIAMVHWGSEFNDQISKTQKKICTLLQSEGVDVILGSHPHYVQKLEFDPIRGRFVAWSLGDFYGDGETNGTQYSILLNLEITKSGTTGNTKVTGFEYVPLYLEKGQNGELQVLRIKEAMAAYENHYLDRITDATYKGMQSALERIQSRVGAK